MYKIVFISDLRVVLNIYDFSNCVMTDSQFIYCCCKYTVSMSYCILCLVYQNGTRSKLFLPGYYTT